VVTNKMAAFCLLEFSGGVGVTVCAITQAARRWLPASAAPFLSQVRSCGIIGGRPYLGAGFPVSPPSSHTYNHSTFINQFILYRLIYLWRL
jgi:hypothetical protein